MAQFDVYALADGLFVVDCQADLLAGLGGRFVIPLVDERDAPPRVARLNPRFDIDGTPLVLAPQLASTVSAKALKGSPLTSLKAHDPVIKRAIDLLVDGV